MANLVPLTLDDLKDFVMRVVKVLREKPLVRKISDGPVLYIGDIHGFFANIRKAVNIAKERSIQNIVFLGDYADRGPQQLKCVLNVCYAFAKSCGMKSKFDFIEDIWDEEFSFNVIALRGNHDNMFTSSMYDFPDEIRKYKKHYWEVEYNRVSSENPDSIELCNMYRMYGTDVDYVLNLIECLYENLPLIVTTTWQTMAIHGGIPEPINDQPAYVVHRLSKMKTPLPSRYFTSQLIPVGDPDKDFKVGLSQLVWNDARPHLQEKKSEFATNIRGGVARGFNRKALQDFLDDADKKRLIRAHDVLMGAMASHWNDSLIHIFSAYPYFGNIGRLAYFIEFPDGNGEFIDGEGNVIQKVAPPS